MKEKEIYPEARKVARQLCDIMQEHDLDNLTALKEWLTENEEAGETIRMLTDSAGLSEKIELYKQCDKEEARRQLQARIHRYEQRRRFLKISAVAAGILLLLGFTGLMTYFVYPYEELPVMSVEPSISGPTLVTASGENVDLSYHAGDSIFRLFGNHILKNEEGLRYVEEDSLMEEYPVGQPFNQLIVPKQCNYQIALCDGSIVHLNAESRLEFPSRFSVGERKVRLTGEAYFEVKHDGRPFIVEVNQVNIRVYGTKFNVNSYDPLHIQTVLTEGSVGISFLDSPQKEQLLKPNQICCVNLETRQQIVQEVEVEKYISWIAGYLRYDHDPLEKLIQDLGRWYGEDFDFLTSDLKSIRISASINKDASLQEVLNMVQTTAKIKFQLKERRYIITR